MMPKGHPGHLTQQKKEFQPGCRSPRGDNERTEDNRSPKRDEQRKVTKELGQQLASRP